MHARVDISRGAGVRDEVVLKKSTHLCLPSPVIIHCVKSHAIVGWHIFRQGYSITPAPQSLCFSYWSVVGPSAVWWKVATAVRVQMKSTQLLWSSCTLVSAWGVPNTDGIIIEGWVRDGCSHSCLSAADGCGEWLEILGMGEEVRWGGVWAVGQMKTIGYGCPNHSFARKEMKERES